MPRCCGGSSCSCVVQAGPHITIDGTGGPSDPFVVTGDVDLAVTDTSTIDLTLNGAGTEAAPWSLHGAFAATSKLNDLGDVNVAPTNGQVLAWNTSTSEWRAVAPTTAAAGAVSVDPSLSGDGSVGSPLQVREDPARMLATTTPGLGLSDAGMNALVRHFADTTTRAAMTPAPALNSLSTLDTNPGQIDYWNGSTWVPSGSIALVSAGPELYPLSGSYTGAQRTTLLVENVETTTDPNGVFDVISASTLSGRAGVLSAQVTPTTGGDPVGSGVPFTVVLAGDSGALRATAYRLDDGAPLPSAPVAVTVSALLY